MNNDIWTETEKGWSCFASDLQDDTPMPRGEYPIKHNQSWKIFKNTEGEITHWTYTYPDGKVATIFND